jgi:hypothetical protein
VISTLCSLGLLLSACGAEPGGSDTSGVADEVGVESAGEVVGSASQALAGGWVTGPFVWQKGEASKVIGNRNEVVCGLTTIQGKFSGPTDSVEVTTSGDNWIITGSGSGQGLRAEAFCYRADGFIPDEGSSGNALTISKRYQAQAFNRFQGTCLAKDVPMYAQDTFSFLTGLRGEMAGAGEFARIEQALVVDTANVLHAQSCAFSVDAFSRSVRIGSPVPLLGKFINKNSQIGNAQQIPEVVVGSDVTNPAATLSPVDKGMCFLTGVQGKFISSSEWVQIRPEPINGVDKWVIRHGRGPLSNVVRGYARCYSRDQR